MVASKADLARARPPLDHPYSALSLLLVLSGSQRWDVGERHDAGRDAHAAGEEVAASAIEGWREPREGPGGEDMAAFEGNSSRLWSVDSESEDGEGEGMEEGEEEGGSSGSSVDLGGGRRARGAGAGCPARDGVRYWGGGGTREWLLDFENDGGGSGSESEGSSARTDGG